MEHFFASIKRFQIDFVLFITFSLSHTRTPTHKRTHTLSQTHTHTHPRAQKHTSSLTPSDPFIFLLSQCHCWDDIGFFRTSWMFRGTEKANWTETPKACYEKITFCKFFEAQVPSEPVYPWEVQQRIDFYLGKLWDVPPRRNWLRTLYGWLKWKQTRKKPSTQRDW